MADPFDVAPPQWYSNMVGRPVDMTAAGTAVGGALFKAVNPIRRENQFDGLKRSALEAEIEAVRSRTAETTVNNLLKRHALREKTQADIETAEFITGNPSPESIIKAEITQRNPLAVRNIWAIKERASKFLASQQKSQFDTGLNTKLTQLMAESDEAAAPEVAALYSRVKQQGWTDTDVADIARIRGGLNARLAAQKVRTGVLPADVQLLEVAKQYRLDGDEKQATMLEAVVTERGRNKGTSEKIERNVTVTETGDDGKKVTRRLTEAEAATVPVPADQDTAKQLADYASEKAALASGDKSVGPDFLGLSDRARKLGELKIKLEQKGINPDTGTRLSAPASAVAPAGLPEGQRVRNRVTGKMGTVTNGVVVPDPELEPAE